MTIHTPIPIDDRLRDVERAMPSARAATPTERSLQAVSGKAGIPIAAARIYCPQGFGAPKHSIAWANYQAACIAAREVRGKAIHSAEHRASLEAWEAGERSWPWPDATGEETARADAAVAFLARGQKGFVRRVRGGL